MAEYRNMAEYIEAQRDEQVRQDAGRTVAELTRDELSELMSNAVAVGVSSALALKQRQDDERAEREKLSPAALAAIRHSERMQGGGGRG